MEEDKQGISRAGCKGTTASLTCSKDAEEDEEEDHEEVLRERMPIELEPDHKGTEIRLEGIKTMQGQAVQRLPLASGFFRCFSVPGCATLQVELLHLQLACFDCRSAAKASEGGSVSGTGL